METKFVKSPVLDCCPDCKGKLHPVRVSNRGNGTFIQPVKDHQGLFCPKCEVIFEVLYEKDSEEK
jgi:uncharacterized protein YbaR (Trm112 family)